MAIDAEALRARLEARLLELESEGASVAEDRKPVELDQQSVGRLSRMDSMQVQAMAQATEQRRNLEARRIRAAIARIDEGEYGLCVTCGEAISEGRLEADPMAAACIGCAGQ